MLLLQNIKKPVITDGLFAFLMTGFKGILLAKSGYFKGSDLIRVSVPRNLSSLL
ncbi:hypothetical protein CLV82_0121 [Zeaxanthinibacter enoshimensis]|uniref:Uncharacterized protein n=1 Tax=Zeaxanthinibacter enoshimensis TaxID=392009 RepID=A0A4R6TTM4_9FLAO|nr:hypothetical protein CLV82_0121 [Zeaxanthinibacter enoshimensis]